MEDRFDTFEKSISTPILKKQFVSTQMPSKKRTDNDFPERKSMNRMTRYNSMKIQNREKLLTNRMMKQRMFTNMMTKHNQLYQNWKIADSLTAIFTTIGLFVALIEYEIGFKYNNGARIMLSETRNVMR